MTRPADPVSWTPEDAIIGISRVLVMTVAPPDGSRAQHPIDVESSSDLRRPGLDGVS